MLQILCKADLGKGYSKVMAIMGRKGIFIFFFLKFYFKNSTLNDKISEIKQGRASQSFKYVEKSVQSR